jgi:hypothetical protein
MTHEQRQLTDEHIALWREGCTNYFPMRVRGAVAWCAGFGRLGGVGGTLIGGLLIVAGPSIATIFLVLAGLALVGVLLTVPASKAAATQGLAVAN